MVDWYRIGGKVHPIRSSPGYENAFVGLSEQDKNYLRDNTGGYTVQSPGRAERIREARERKPFVGRLAHSVAENRFKPRYKKRLY